MKHVECGYGYYPGGDPRRFHVDEECATPEELERHRLACAAWDQGETPDPGGPHVPLVDGDGIQCGHLTLAHYGLGTYEIEWDCEGDPECWECHPEKVPPIDEQLERLARGEAP